MAGTNSDNITTTMRTYSDVVKPGPNQKQIELQPLFNGQEQPLLNGQEQPLSEDIVTKDTPKTAEEMLDEIRKLKIKVANYQRNNANLKKKFDAAELENQKLSKENKKLSVQFKVEETVKWHLTDVVYELRSKYRKK